MNVLVNSWFALVLSIGAPRQPADTVSANQVCSHGNGFVAPCRAVRGRLRVYSDNVPLRIWPVGTSRLLGVQSDQSSFYLPVTCRLPEALSHIIGPDVDIYADFIVRPLASASADSMERVCVASISAMRVEHRSVRSGS
jgi:hypothetical protein